MSIFRLAVLIWLLGLVFCSRADPCTLAANNVLGGTQFWAGTPTTLANCINSIPFNLTRATLTINVLRQLAQLYSYTDIAMNSGPPWNIQVDLVGGLNNITAKFSTYTDDYQFHEDLIILFASLRDGHTRYLAPQPYSNCWMIRPFSFYAVYQQNQLQIFLEQGVYTPNEFNSITGFDYSPYVGQQLTQINGQPILSWLQSFSDQYVGIYKDPGIRVSSLFEFTGFLSVVSLGEIPFDDFLSDETFTIGGSNVIIPKVVMCPPTNNTNSWISAIDTPLPPSNNYKKRSLSAPQNFQSHYPDIHRERRERLKKVFGTLKPPPVVIKPNNFDLKHKPLRREAKQAVETIQLTVYTGDPSRLQIEGKTQYDDSLWYGVYTDAGENIYSWLKVTSFEPENQTDFLTVLGNWIDDYINNGYNKVIIDVSKNGGGIICLALLLQSVLIPQWVTGQIVGNTSQQVWTPYDLRQSNITDELVAIGYFPLGNFRHFNGTVYRDNSWYTPPLIRTRGGVTGPFSQQFLFPYDQCLPYFVPSLNFFPTDIMIITDGTCGSACSLFVTKFQRYQRAIVVSYGGIPGGNIDSSSFAGGAAWTWSNFIASLSSFPNFPNQPQPLPTSALTGFNQFEMYMGVQEITPREWNKFPTNYHLFWWDAVFNDDLSTQGGVQAVATLFESAVTGVWGSPPHITSEAHCISSESLFLVFIMLLFIIWTFIMNQRNFLGEVH